MANKKDNGFDFSAFLEKLKTEKNADSRHEGTIDQREYFLIVCEGERTEPEYFKGFQKILPRRILDTIEIHGEGMNTINVVSKALMLKAKRQQSLLPNYNQVWAVFDEDGFPRQRVNEACELAVQNSIFAGFSNEAFELWYLLHFQYLDTGITRHPYVEILDQIFQEKDGSRYLKNRPDIYDYLSKYDNQNIAIRHAQRLHTFFEEKTPSDSKPSTSVHLLVIELNRYLKL